MNKTAFPILLLSACLAPVALADVQRLEFNSDDVTIPAYLHIPDSESAEALVVYLHGNPGTVLQPESKLADVLLANNLAVFRFNYRGLWGNGGDFNLTNSIEDMQNAIDFLLAENNLDKFGIDSRRLVLLGYSFGTAVVLSGAHNDERVDSIVAFAPCDHGYFGAEFVDPDSEIRGFLDDVNEQLFGEDGPIDQNPAVFVDDLVANAQKFRFEPIAPALANTSTSEWTFFSFTTTSNFRLPAWENWRFVSAKCKMRWYLPGSTSRTYFNPRFDHRSVW